MRRLPFALLALGVSLTACNEPPPRRLIVRAGRLLDGTGAPPREAVRMIIEAGTIVAIEPDEGLLPDAAVVDARGETVLAGLVNAHTHLLNAGACAAGIGTGLGAALRNLESLLTAGVTTAADLAAPTHAAVGLRRYVGTGRSRGPRLVVAGALLTARDGYLTDIEPFVAGGVVLPVDSPTAARDRVRELAEAGVDVIKVGVQEVGFDLRPLPMLAGETLCAAVDEAHVQDLRVLAHATTVDGYNAALDCKVDALVHGAVEPLPQGILDRLAATRVPVAPTLHVLAAPLWGPAHLDRYDRDDIRRTMGEESFATLATYAARVAAGDPVLPDFPFHGVPRAAAAAAPRTATANVMLLRGAGVPLAFGTDGGSCMNPLGSPLFELEALVAAGLTPREALVAATLGSASLLGLGEALGRLAAGFRADFITVRGRPDERIADIDEVHRIFVDGIEQHPERPWYALPLAALSVAWTWLGG